MAEGNVRIPYISIEQSSGSTGAAGVFVSDIDFSTNIIGFRVVTPLGGNLYGSIRSSGSNKAVVLVSDEAGTKTNTDIVLTVYKLNL